MLWHKKICEELGLKGRVLIAHEGINGTLEGLTEKTEEYVALLNAFDGTTKAGIEGAENFGDFHDVIFKRSEGNGIAFPKLKVKVRPEIVSLRLRDAGDEDIDPNKITGTHLPPEELHKWFESGEEFHIIDMRNGYEFPVGHFKGSIDPGMQNFRDLPKVLPKLEHLKKKKVLTVCTGGVRCEKASGYLKSKGFEDVYQLDGGIVKYMEKYPGEDFLGSLYVFDNRVVMNFDGEVQAGVREGKTHDVVGHCLRCGRASERYVNCLNPECNLHFICCAACEESVHNILLGTTGSLSVGADLTAPEIKHVTLCPNGCRAGVGEKALVTV